MVRQRTSEDRIPLFELMAVNARMKELISTSKISQISKEIDLFHTEGMISFDKCIMDMLKKGKISIDTALAYSDNPNDLKLKIKTSGIKY